MKVEGDRRMPIWLNLLRMLMKYRLEQVKLLQTRGKLVKYLDERSTLAQIRISHFMQRGMSQEEAEELTYSQLLDMGEVCAPPTKHDGEMG